MKKCKSCKEICYADEIEEGLCPGCHEKEEERIEQACETKHVGKRIGHARRIFGIQKMKK